MKINKQVNHFRIFEMTLKMNICSDYVCWKSCSGLDGPYKKWKMKRRHPFRDVGASGRSEFSQFHCPANAQ